MKATNAKPSWRLGYDEADGKKAHRRCDHPGCPQDGEYRAPQARDRLNEYYWFCLDHVRAYNAAWNYYAGMSADEIEGELRRDTTWQRPTWPLGTKTANRRFAFSVHDPFGVFDDDEEEDSARAKAAAGRSPEEQAMRVMALEPPLTLVALRARYRELVKIHHPDANGGDKAAEEKCKEINQAYNTLLNSLNE
ncbi:MAG: DnaJ domain-containing protein [Magnetospirillum sp.]|nr:DnaJ domain-containing protein [Magnetospirillum sp.]